MTPLHDAREAFLLQNMTAVGGGASYAQLASWGAERTDIVRLLRRGAIVRARRGYYVLPASDDQADRWRRERQEHLRQICALTSGENVASLRSGAIVWGLPVSTVPRQPELIRPPRSGGLFGVRVIRRPLKTDEVAAVDGVSVTTLERTCVEVALDLPTPLALITVDAALRRGADRQHMLRIVSDMGPVRHIREARRTLEWADGFSESPLESRGRGELMLQRVPRPWNNVSLRMDGVEFRTDHWWDRLGIAGEADGRGKYDGPTATPDPVWTEKLRQQWFEDELGLFVLRYIDREIRHTPADVAARWRRSEAKRAQQLWVPPAALEIFQRPVPGSDDPIRWLRRRNES